MHLMDSQAFRFWLHGLEWNGLELDSIYLEVLRHLS
jgi:hypothetical protein